MIFMGSAMSYGFFAADLAMIKKTATFFYGKLLSFLIKIKNLFCYKSEQI